MPGMVLGILIGAGILDIVPEVWFRRMLGALACIFAVLQVDEGSGTGECETAGTVDAFWRWCDFGDGFHIGFCRWRDFDVVFVAAGPDRAYVCGYCVDFWHCFESFEVDALCFFGID